MVIINHIQQSWNGNSILILSTDKYCWTKKPIKYVVLVGAANDSLIDNFKEKKSLTVIRQLSALWLQYPNTDFEASGKPFTKSLNSCYNFY